MTPLLRQPSGLARHCSSAVRAASRSSLAPSYLSRGVASPWTSRRPRFYATVTPGNPQGGKEGKDTKNSSDEKKQSQERGSLPPSSRKDPSSAQDANGSTNPSAGPPPPTGGRQKGAGSSDPLWSTKLSPQEEEFMQQVLSRMKQTLPSRMMKEVEATFDAMRREGISPELRELMDELKSKPMDLPMAIKLLRISTKSATRMAEKQMAEKQTAEGDGTKPKASSTQNQEQAQSSSSHQREGDKDTSGQQSSKRFEVKLDPTWIIAGVVSSILLSSLGGDSEKEMTWQEFRRTFFDKGLVEKLTVLNGTRVRVDLNREAVAQVYQDSEGTQVNSRYYFSIGSVDAFERRLEEAQQELGIPGSERVPVSYKATISAYDIIASVAPTLFVVAALVWLSRRATGAGGGQNGIFGIGKSRAKMFNHESDVKVKFKDVAGMDEAKQEIMEFVSFLKQPGQYQRLGAKIPRGAILSGPPGTGKTLLAKATAGESGVPFFSVSGSEFVEMFVGVGPSRVRDLFAKARKHTPCIIFIDEIDAIGKSRSARTYGGGNDERESTLNQILTEMDGFNTSEQVVVLAGTNRVDVLDKALLRPGRFDRHISVDRPTMEGRKQIFAVHMRNIVTSEDIDFLTGRLAALTPGFSGADIANCVNEAALIAARTSAATVEIKHFEQAIERVIGGLEKKSLVLSPEEKKVVAYHEAGHAICGWYFRYADPLLKVSIIPRGQGALGYAQYLPPGDSYLMNVNQLMDRMAMTLGGRVSEELHFDTVTSGASDDFNKVTRMATAMVTKWGMSKKIGYLFFEEEDNRLHKPFSEETAKNIDAEVRRIVDEAYKQCRDLLTQKKHELAKVAEELLKLEVLTRDDMERLLGKRAFDDNKEFAKYFGGKRAPEPGAAAKDPHLPLPSEQVDPPSPNSPPEMPSPA